MDHIPVLLHETIRLLALRPGMTVVDATFGRGGHAAHIAEAIGPTGLLIAFDADERNIAHAASKSFQSRTAFIMGNFRKMNTLLAERGISPGAVNACVFDLGLNSLQLESSGRGFSFQTDEPLVMTLEAHPGEQALTAQEIIHEWSEESLESILRGFGGEQFATRIARALVHARTRETIETTRQLADIVTQAVPPFYRRRRIHPATKTFQALRIAVNDELGALREGLVHAWEYLAPAGRLAVISFHDGEDRIVKQFFKNLVPEKGTLLNKKPIVPSRDEVLENPRARSAKLRGIQKNETRLNTT